MKLKKIYVFFIFLCLLTFLFTPLNIVKAEEKDYYLGGIPAGFTISERGARVIKTCSVITKDGLISPANDNDILINDVILYIDNIETNNAKDVAERIKNKKEVNVTIKRKNEVLLKKVKPVKDIYGHNKLGLILSDEINGIGTITYFHNGTFASLGHAILDKDNKIYKIHSGNIYFANITDVVKGTSGKAGELKGIFYNDKNIGKVIKNTSTGCYGVVNDDTILKNLRKIKIGNAEIGEATVYTTVQGEKPTEYTIQIVKNDSLFKDEKNLVIKITSKELISKTGGIIQGMSGSPIIQKGKLVGAITHVFINDPTRGYGIKIQDMINN